MTAQPFSYDEEPSYITSDGGALLDELHAAITRYVVLPSPEAGDAVVLWIAATHGQPAWEHATRLVITAPEKRCGKSRLLDVVEATCYRPLLTTNISPAALVRSIDLDPPTLLIDEADAIWGRKANDNHEDLRGLVNAGHQRNRPYVRWDATARQAENCPTFAMAAMAGIGSMPDTIEDRAIVVKMRRRAPGEVVQSYRTRRDGPVLEKLRDRVTLWAREHLEDLTAAEPEMPVDDRAADNWESLIAVADLAGGTWPARAREACRALTKTADEDSTLGERLLSDLRVIFGDHVALHTETLLDALHKVDEAPWADWYGKPLTPRNLANLLKGYGIKSLDVNVSGVTKKGYRREHLYDAWTRYLPEPPGGSATSATSATAQVNGTHQVAGSVSHPLPATSRTALTSAVAQVAQVAHTPNDTLPVYLCDVCRAPLDLGLATAGDTTHPTCSKETAA